MDQLKQKLLQRESDLDNLAMQLRKCLLNVPEGRLRISSTKGCLQYQWINGNERRNVRYLKKKNLDVIKALAQKYYDRKLLNQVEKEQKMIRQVLKVYTPSKLGEVYPKMSEKRRNLVDPRFSSKEERAAAWLSIPYEKKPIYDEEAEIYAEKCDRVRSKSEKMIADKLLLMGIPYKYECPLYLNGFGKIYPDFTLFDAEHETEIYLEHLGMLDDPQYASKAVQRIEAYEKNKIFPGDRLLLTFETSNRPMNMRLFESMIMKRFSDPQEDFIMFREC